MRLRILIGSLVISILGIILFSFGATQVYYEASIEEAKNYLEVYCNQFDDDIYTKDTSGAEKFSESLSGARVTIMNLYGIVLGDSVEADDVEVAADHSDRPEVVDAMANGYGFDVRKSDTLGKKMAYYCINTGTCLLRVAVYTSSEWAMFVKALPTIATFMAIDIVVCVLLALLGTYLILRPIEKLAHESGMEQEISTSYTELKPLVALLNERNANLSFQMNELKKEKEIVERTQNSKDELISNITHEMNTPLTAIKGYAELLENGNLTPEQQKTEYKTKYEQNEKQTNHNTNIINYNEITNDDLPPYDVDISAIVKDIISAVKPEADKQNVTIEEKIEDGVMVLARHERVSELCGNLIRNAIRYNKPDGKVTVTLTKGYLRVEDTGIGIADENKDKIFSRFFTVDKSHSGQNGGFGLGLAVCKRICKRAGWTINVESKLGEGSCFTVSFNKD